MGGHCQDQEQSQVKNLDVENTAQRSGLEITFRDEPTPVTPLVPKTSDLQGVRRRVWGHSQDGTVW